MEIDPIINVGKSEQSLGNVRPPLYRCAFCRRGFSNAQALGGHMNIHRKDRAKLREFSTHNNFLSLSHVNDHNVNNQEVSDLARVNSSDDDELASERPREDVTRGNNNLDDIEKNNNPLLLPLFVESPSPITIKLTGASPGIDSSINNNGREGDCVILDSSEDVKKLSTGAPSASSPELDLELRLGVETQPAAAT